MTDISSLIVFVNSENFHLAFLDENLFHNRYVVYLWGNRYTEPVLDTRDPNGPKNRMPGDYVNWSEK